MHTHLVNHLQNEDNFLLCSTPRATAPT